MTRIVIIGTGNVARQLFDAFNKNEEAEVVQVIGRRMEALEFFEGRTRVSTGPDELLPAEFYILAVSDQAVEEVATGLKVSEGIVLHTAGLIPMSSLASFPSRGVIYPLQTMSPGRQIDFRQVPICIEAAESPDLEKLKTLASLLSERVVEVSSAQRRVLHLAAVFVNNFSNHMFHLGYMLCETGGLPADMLHPLIEETTAKLETMSPFDAQTGPARRGDQITLQTHEALLVDPQQKEIYRLISQSIASLYGQKL